MTNLGWSQFGLTLEDLNLGQLGVIPILVNLGWSQFGSTWGDLNLGQLGVIQIWVNLGNPLGIGWPISGDPNLGQLGVIPIWVLVSLMWLNLRWSQFVSTWGYPNLGQLGLILILGQLCVIPIWVKFSWSQFVSTCLSLNHFFRWAIDLSGLVPTYVIISFLLSNCLHFRPDRSQYLFNQSGLTGILKIWQALYNAYYCVVGF